MVIGELLLTGRTITTPGRREPTREFAHDHR
jgi:hypothetical protein